MKENKSSFAFLTFGETMDSSKASEGFKRYVGYGSSYVLAVNPTKKEQDKLMGFESQIEPEYTGSDDNGKIAKVTFIVRTDPKTCNGVKITNFFTITLHNTPAYSKDGSSVQVIDDYGNYTWANAEDAKAGKTLASNLKIDHSHYRIAASGEADLVAFLKAYLMVPSSLDYTNGVWTVKEDADKGKFKLDSIKDYFKGDFTEIKNAIALQPNNKVMLLYGVRTNDEGKQYQTVATRGELVLRNNANASIIEKAAKSLANTKNSGYYTNIDFRVQELSEYTIEPTNLETPVNNEQVEDENDMPFPPENSDSSGLPWG